MKSPINLVILAAGLGTRMKSKRAKVLHRAGGSTLIEHVVNTTLGIAPAEHVTVVVGHQAEQVKAVLAHTGVRSVEQAEQKGTGHAVMMCRAALVSQGGMVVDRKSDTQDLQPRSAQFLAGEVTSGLRMNVLRANVKLNVLTIPGLKMCVSFSVAL